LKENNSSPTVEAIQKFELKSTAKSKVKISILRRSACAVYLARNSCRFFSVVFKS